MKKAPVIARILIGVVLLWNLQCAFLFISNPIRYLDGFGLEGVAGEQMVRAIGLLFVMWNVPYSFALANPLRNRVSLVEAVWMQAIGLAGETAILLLGGPYPSRIIQTITRFIAFDGVGLVFLVLAYVLVKPLEKSH